MSEPSADIDKVLISEEEIRRRVGELASQVESDFAGRDLVVVGLLTGTLMFLADLVREIDQVTEHVISGSSDTVRQRGVERFRADV